MMMSDLRPELENFLHVHWKICNITLIYGQLSKITTAQDFGVQEHNAYLSFYEGEQQSCLV